MRRLAAVATGPLLVAVLTSCGPDVRVTVVNDSGSRLDSLRVVGQIASRTLRSLAPGESAAVTVPVPGEDMIGLRGQWGGRPLPPAMGTYVEPAHRVRLRVDSAGAVRAVTRVGMY
jgi:hypothetical protein